MKSTILRRLLLSTFAACQAVALTACAPKVVEIGDAAVIPPADYCSTVTNYSSSTITVSGNAYYAPRTGGDGEVEDGGYKYRPAAVANGTVYSITVGGVTGSYTANASDDEASVTVKLAAAINANPSAVVTASQLRIKTGSYEYYVLLNLKNYGVWPAKSKSGTLNETARVAPKPIRYAEVMVKDSSGNILQCGLTNNAGAYSVTLPQAASGTYTVYVNSRILSSTKARAYVLDHHQTNAHYSVTKSVSATATSASNNMLASGEGAVLSGAFNILDQIIKTNEYLASEVNGAHGCGTTFANCPTFTAAPLVYAYWKKGVNPYTYFGSSSLSSFYIGDSKLFILGGSNGDVNNMDCDHFDNSVIIHEYGHFLEDVYAVSESPGGFHDANSIIDPRLAWSEGWADFIQGAVTGLDYYLDTRGNSSGTLATTSLLNISLEDEDQDVPIGGAEGLFREFSVTRLLWDAIDPHPSGVAASVEAWDNVSNANSMAEIWTVFAGTNGFQNSANVFRHMGTFHTLQSVMANATSWNSLRSREKQNANTAYNGVGLREYANPLNSNGACTVNIDPITDGGTFDNTNLLTNNDFYSYYHSGGTLSVQLTYDTGALADPPDLDLYVYDSQYTYGSSSSMVGYSQNDRPDCTPTAANCTGISESVSKSAPAGYYMINVMAYTNPSPGGLANYNLRIGGVQKCPQY